MDYCVFQKPCINPIDKLYLNTQPCTTAEMNTKLNIEDRIVSESVDVPLPGHTMSWGNSPDHRQKVPGDSASATPRAAQRQGGLGRVCGGCG